jgi:adenylate cyclase
MPQTRKLAAIMFTDIVGYTALMGNDEEKAFRVLELNRQIHKSSLQDFNGTWLKEIGDGVLASFNTITDAVLCAQQIRDKCEKEGQYSLRIGIHQGEVVFENDDVFGEGVNLASRLQAAAPPGGIYLSDSVARNFENKKGLVISYAGEKNLKNVSFPVTVYELLREGETAVAKPVPHQSFEKSAGSFSSKKRWFFYAITAVALLASGYFLITEFSSSASIRGEKTVAVLPFKNLNPVDTTDFFVTGVHEDIINRLAGLKDLTVISRTSVLRFSETQDELAVIGRKLRANYIVEGSVSKLNNRIRVAVQLFDAITGKSLWSDSYEKELSDVFAVQAEIAGAISKTLKAKISSKEKGRLQAIPTDNLEAYDDFVRARSILNSSQLTYEKIMQAIGFLQKATEADKNFADAWGLLSQAQGSRFEKVSKYDNREDEVKQASEESEIALSKAKELEPGGVAALRAEGYFYKTVKNDAVQALRSFDKALEVLPNDAKTLMFQAAIFF